MRYPSHSYSQRLEDEIEIEMPDGEIQEVEVAICTTPCVKGCRSGHPDNWTPDEPGEIDIEHIKDCGKYISVNEWLDKYIDEQYHKDYIGKLYKSANYLVSHNYYPDYNDDGDAYDRWRDEQDDRGYDNSYDSDYL
jgi:hypothetical protein